MRIHQVLWLLICVVAAVTINAGFVSDSASQQAKPVKLSLPLAARNAAGVDFERQALVAAIAEDGCSTSCSGGTLFCTIQATDDASHTLTFACGCCGKAANCASPSAKKLKLLARPADLLVNQDVMEVDAVPIE